MNILHISRTMGQGGAEKVVFQICKDSNKYKMFVASTGGFYENDLKKYGIKHYRIPDIARKNPLVLLKTFFILKRIIINEKIDIVHSHHRMAAFYSRILNIFNKNFNRIYTSHNIFHDKVKFLRFALKGSRIVAVGDGVKSNLINEYGIKENLIDVIYNSIDVPQVIEESKDDIFQKKDNKIFIGTIGRLSEQKGIDIFLKALYPLIKKNKDIYGVIIGDGELREELFRLSKELKISNNIYFLGYRKDVFSLIKKMDFIVLASRWEGFPLTPIEVFSQRRTIIASNISGNDEIVKDYYNGLLFEKDNVEELSSKINMLVNDYELNKKLSQNASKTYQDKYRYEKFIKDYNEEYNSTKEGSYE